MGLVTVPDKVYTTNQTKKKNRYYEMAINQNEEENTVRMITSKRRGSVSALVKVIRWNEEDDYNNSNDNNKDNHDKNCN